MDGHGQLPCQHMGITPFLGQDQRLLAIIKDIGADMVHAPGNGDLFQPPAEAEGILPDGIRTHRERLLY